ncbi:MAG: TatD family hydrolase [Anaerolineaceae bacterium]|nr:TatD family hydrolase [Anaerolineaceae bacterium]
MKFTDTHCHLEFDAFDKDRNETIDRAKTAGLFFILNPGIDLPSSKLAIELTTMYNGLIFAGIGMHPNYGKTWEHSTLEELRKLASEENVKAIGEIGLDYYRQHTPHDLQKLIFREQLALAKELDLPVLIHNRDATIDLMPILAEWYQSLHQSSPLIQKPGVLHSFSDDAGTAKKAIEMNFFIGVTGPVTFKNALDRKEMVANLPMEKILLETDAPFLTPHPYRGRRNEPCYIPHIAEEIARLKNISVSEVASITSQNTSFLFDL